MTGGGLSNDTIVPYALVVVREGYNANLLVYPALTDSLLAVQYNLFHFVSDFSIFITGHARQFP